MKKKQLHNIYKRTCIRIYKGLLKLNNGERNNPIKKWEKYLNKHFTEGIRMTNKHTQRFSSVICEN